MPWLPPGLATKPWVALVRKKPNAFWGRSNARRTRLFAVAEALPEDEASWKELTAILESRRTTANDAAEAARAAMTAHEADLVRLNEQKVRIEARSAELTGKLEQVTASVDAMTNQVAEFTSSLAASEESLSSKFDRWVELAETQGLLASLNPLTPEQMAWSIMQVTGVLPNHIDASRNELNAATPPTEEQAADPAWLASREREATIAALDKLQGSVNVFVNLFGNGAGQPQDGFFATADQSLFFANGGTLHGWISSGGRSLRQRLLTLDDPQQVADELALTLFTRHATAEEVRWVAEIWPAAGEDRSAAIQELAWGWITSVEFRFDR